MTETNIMLSKYLFGEPEQNGYYQIGYTSDNLPKVRTTKDIGSDYWSNFHNDWGLLMDVISKMAKDDIEDFSEADIIIDELKNAMFQFSYDITVAYNIVCRYVRLKLMV